MSPTLRSPLEPSQADRHPDQLRNEPSRRRRWTRPRKKRGRLIRVLTAGFCFKCYFNPNRHHFSIHRTARARRHRAHAGTRPPAHDPGTLQQCRGSARARAATMCLHITKSRHDARPSDAAAQTREDTSRGPRTTQTARCRWLCWTTNRQEYS